MQKCGLRGPGARVTRPLRFQLYQTHRLNVEFTNDLVVAEDDDARHAAFTDLSHLRTNTRRRKDDDRPPITYERVRR